MDHAFWHARWQANEIGFHQEEINAHLQSYWPRLDVAAGATVFVPLCGKSRDMLWLASRGHRVLGVEISPIAAAAFFAENDLPVEPIEQERFVLRRAGEIALLEGDYFDLRPDDLRGVAAVYDRASLIALPPDLRAAYAAQMAQLLPAGTPSLLVTLDYDQAEMSGPPFAVGAAEVEALFAADFRIEELDALDILDENPRFRARGLTRLAERIFRLTRR
ncbi:MAG: thiopurine S-methyltransferase [Gammaproteobacteria bacterium]